MLARAGPKTTHTYFIILTRMVYAPARCYTKNLNSRLSSSMEYLLTRFFGRADLNEANERIIQLGTKVYKLYNILTMSLRIFIQYMNPYTPSQYVSFKYSNVTVDSFLVFTCDFEISPLLYCGLSLEDAGEEIEAGIEWLLPMLKEKDIMATFFVEGLLCKWFPHLVEMLGEAGHEIGCHGYVHASYGGVWFPYDTEFPRIFL